MSAGARDPVTPLQPRCGSATGDAATVERLRAEVAELQAAVRARDEFISMAAHELRNPMTPLLIQAQLLSTLARASGGAVPERIVEGLERLEGLIAQYLRRASVLLEVSRLTSGAFRLECLHLDLSAAVAEAATRIAPLAERADCAMSVHVDAGLSAWLDPLAIELVADNLLSNAVKYGAGAPVELSLRADGAWARIAVRDHGIGISEQDQARIFARFERAVTRREAGGFGVGLWIVGRLVAAMGGTLAVESRIGEGSTFVVRLPLAAKQEDL